LMTNFVHNCDVKGKYVKKFIDEHKFRLHEKKESEKGLMRCKEHINEPVWMRACMGICRNMNMVSFEKYFKPNVEKYQRIAVMLNDKIQILENQAVAMSVKSGAKEAEKKEQKERDGEGEEEDEDKEEDEDEEKGEGEEGDETEKGGEAGGESGSQPAQAERKLSEAYRHVKGRYYERRTAETAPQGKATPGAKTQGNAPKGNQAPGAASSGAKTPGTAKSGVNAQGGAKGAASAKAGAKEGAKGTGKGKSGAEGEDSAKGEAAELPTSSQYYATKILSDLRESLYLDEVILPSLGGAVNLAKYSIVIDDPLTDHLENAFSELHTTQYSMTKESPGKNKESYEERRLKEVDDGTKKPEGSTNSTSTDAKPKSKEDEEIDVDKDNTGINPVMAANFDITKETIIQLKKDIIAEIHMREALPDKSSAIYKSVLFTMLIIQFNFS